MFSREFYYYSGKNYNTCSEFNFTYKSVGAGVIAEICLKLSHNNEIGLTIQFAKTPTGLALNQLLMTNFSKDESGFNFLRTLRQDPPTLYIKSRDGRKDNIIPIIQYLQRDGVIDSATYEMLVTDISTPCQRAEVLAMLIDVAEKDIDVALKKANEWRCYDYDQAIFDFAKYLTDKRQYDHAIMCYELYDDQHSDYYVDAQLKAKLLKLKAHADNVIHLTREQIQKYKEDLLIILFNKGDTRSASQYFIELSGLSISIDEFEIKPTANTFVRLASQISKLTEKVAVLESQIQSKSTSSLKMFDQKVMVSVEQHDAMENKESKSCSSSTFRM